MDIEERFNKYDNEYGKFDRIKNKRSQRKDMHAFILLDKLFPGEYNIIAWAGHDEIALEFSEDQIETLTDDNILELVRCSFYISDDALMKNV